jgi:hypothetical protein
LWFCCEGNSNYSDEDSAGVVTRVESISKMAAEISQNGTYSPQEMEVLDEVTENA